MIELPPDVWAMLLFSVAVFFGGSIWALSYSLFQEERKMKILNQEGALDTYSPRALRDLNDWLHAHPDPDSPAVQEGLEAYRKCVKALRSNTQYFYDWTDDDIDRLETLSES
jgi:hypothetical protein